MYCVINIIHTYIYTHTYIYILCVILKYTSYINIFCSWQPVACAAAIAKSQIRIGQTCEKAQLCPAKSGPILAPYAEIVSFSACLLKSQSTVSEESISC